MVRLVPETVPLYNCYICGFNPTVVRLVREHNLAGVYKDPRFNPTVVRLVQVKVNRSSLARYRFNPTVVRLVPEARRAQVLRTAPFQSHRGSISTHSSPPNG